MLNQFSMDELDGVLRVATSSGWVPDPSVSSNLTTLSERDGALSQLASIGGIAPTEDIRSVRFDGTRGFVVTFKKTDPLFVFDLTEPSAPRKLGELKIPGFSTYMHPLDHDHLLAIGFDADDHGSFAFFDGIQLQIFDVSQLDDPKLLHKTTIGTRGSASEALTNHLAFNYFPARGLLALPMSVCGVVTTAFTPTSSPSAADGLRRLAGEGITERGRMPFVDTSRFRQAWRERVVQHWWPRARPPTSSGASSWTTMRLASATRAIRSRRSRIEPRRANAATGAVSNHDLPRRAPPATCASLLTPRRAARS